APPPAAPLVGAQRAGPLKLHGRFVELHAKRHAGGTGSLLQVQRLIAVCRREQVIAAFADVLLGQQWNGTEIVEAANVLRAQANLIKLGAIVGASIEGMC